MQWWKVNRLCLQVVDPGFPKRGVPTPEFGVKTYYMARLLSKTEWKWKKLDGGTSLPPPIRSVNVYVSVMLFTSVFAMFVENYRLIIEFSLKWSKPKDFYFGEIISTKSVDSWKWADVPRICDSCHVRLGLKTQNGSGRMLFFWIDMKAQRALQEDELCKTNPYVSVSLWHVHSTVKYVHWQIANQRTEVFDRKEMRSVFITRETIGWSDFM